MGFTEPCVSDEDQVGGIFDPGRTGEGQDIVLADLRIEMPIELVQRLHMFDSGHPEKLFDLILPSVFDLHLKKSDHDLPLIGGDLPGRSLAGDTYSVSGLEL